MNEGKRRPDAGRDWYIRGPLIGLAAIGALLAVCALLLAKGLLPGGLIDELTVASVFLGGCAGGAGAARRRGRGVLAAGAAAGGALALVLVMAVALSLEGRVFSQNDLRMLLALMAGSVAGGGLCLKNRVTKIKKKKR